MSSGMLEISVVPSAEPKGAKPADSVWKACRHWRYTPTSRSNLPTSADSSCRKAPLGRNCAATKCGSAPSGSVFSCGTGHDGRLGHGPNVTSLRTPAAIESLTQEFL